MLVDYFSIGFVLVVKETELGRVFIKA